LKKRSHKNKDGKGAAEGSVLDPDQAEPGKNGQEGDVKGQRKQPKKKKKK
jgi:hypothetical protein